MLKTVLILLLKILAGIVAICVLYVGVAYLCSFIPTRPNKRPGPLPHTLYVHSNGVHTDMILPVELLPADLVRQLQPVPGTRYLGIGWGDKGFYLDTPTWAELKFSTAFRAMVLKSPTAMHVTHYSRIGDDWFAFPIDGEQLEIFHTYLWSSFQTPQAGVIVPIPDSGYTPRDFFYEANGNYQAFQTCNEWVNDALKLMHVKTAIWSPFDWGILRWRQPT